MPSRDDAARVETTAVIREAIASIVFDRGTSMGTVTRHDGVSATIKLSSATFEPSSTIARVTYLPAEDLVRFLTVRGDEVVAEMPPDGDALPIDGRPVLYLDQKDWSLLATSVHEPSRLTPQDRAAARTVIELAEAGRVVLPMSAGHMTETCKWADRDRRYRLALTITGLSRGWQMRSPIAIRTHELRQSLLSPIGARRQVLTQEVDRVQPARAAPASDFATGYVRGPPRRRCSRGPLVRHLLPDSAWLPTRCSWLEPADLPCPARDLGFGLLCGFGAT